MGRRARSRRLGRGSIRRLLRVLHRWEVDGGRRVVMGRGLVRALACSK